MSNLTIQEQRLEYELADVLKDRKSLGAYEIFVKKYKEEFLREILAIVMATPEEKIKKTRGAYFTYLVKQHEKYGSDSRN